jgi:hypothetical protein
VNEAVNDTICAPYFILDVEMELFYKFKTKDYQEGDMVWMWDTKRGEPTNVKGNAQFWLGPFRVRMKSVNDSYYLSMLEGRRHPLLVSGHLLKPHQGEKT